MSSDVIARPWPKSGDGEAVRRLALFLSPALILTVSAGVIFAIRENDWRAALAIPAVCIPFYLAIVLWRRQQLPALVFTWTFGLYVLIAAVTQAVNPLYGVRFSTPDSNVFLAAARGDYGEIGFELVHLTKGVGSLDTTLTSVIYQHVLQILYVFDPRFFDWPLFTVNAVLAAAVVMMTTNLARVVFSNAPAPVHAATLLSALCPQYMYYSAELLRDGLAALLTVVMLYAAAVAVRDPRPSRLLGGLIVIAAASTLMLFVRTQFVFLGLVVVGGFGIASFVFARRTKARTIALATAVLIVGVIGYAVLPTIMDTLDVATRFLKFYSAVSDATGGLGLLIVHLPLPARIPVGMVYEHIFPVPLWLYFTPDSPPASWLVSLNGIWIVMLVPLAFVGLTTFAGNKAKATVLRPAIAICAIAYVVNLVVVAATSLEVRHISALYPAFFMLAATPFAIGPSVATLLRSVSRAWLSLIVLIHVVWALLKFVF